MKTYIHTWGCQMNKHQSEAIAGILKSNDHQLVSDLEEADIVIFNTCIVRKKPEDKVFSEIGIVEKMKEENPDIVLGIGGCMGQVRGEELFRQSPAVDFVFGTSELNKLPSIIEKARTQRGSNLICMEDTPRTIDRTPFHRNSEFKAYVTISQGCSNYCSFCIVPRARGPLRSRPMEEVLNEVVNITRSGYKEVILLGQNVNAYGADLTHTSFAELLAKIDDMDIPRVRFTSPHPKDFTDEVIQLIGESNNICNHLHLPIQSGSNRVLEDMNRGYSREYFVELTDKIKRQIPGVNITTDIIVGYPGETEEDFQDTVEVMERVKFGSSYIFKYSPREHTRSFYREDNVPDVEKQRRLETLLNLQKEINQKEHRKKVGECTEVLVEGRSRNGDSELYGKSRDMKSIVFQGDHELIGELVQVEITDTSPGSLTGILSGC